MLSYSNWKDTYKSRLRTFEEAVNELKDGDSMTTTSGVGGPSAPFMELLFDRVISGDLKDFTLTDGVCIKPHKYHKPENVSKWFGKINWRTTYFTAVNIALSKMRAMDYMPMCGADAWWRTAYGANVLYISVTPPNELGFVNTSCASFSTPDVVAEWNRMGKDHLIIAEVNENLPWVFGDTMYHVSEIDIFIEHNSPLAQMTRAEPTEIESAIGGYVASLINDRDTIQMGWGGVSEAVISNLQNVRDLGVVSEVIPAGLPRLCEEGIITNKYKPFYTGKTVAGLCTGNQELYDFMNMNPTAILTRCKETNDIGFIAKHPNMKAINTTAMIDLTGVSTAEGNGHFEFSGCGGQLEFVVGSHYSPGGASINLLPSSRVNKNGERLSNILPELPAGTPVTIPRTVHDFIVTEYGIADLRLKDRRQRAEELISVAHPDFRGELRKAAFTNFYPVTK